MGLAWVSDDQGRTGHYGHVGYAMPPGAGRDLPGRPRHRRPTLLVRSSQAVACKITALARTEPGLGESRATPPPRRGAMAARRYWV